MYYGSGNYEAFAHAKKPEGIEQKSAIIIGGGLAGLAAAAFLVRDAQMPGKNITIMERRSVTGGSCDGLRIPGYGYVMSGGREMDNHFECMWDLFRDIPDIDDPETSMLDNYYWLNKEDPNYSLCRVTYRRGQNAHTDGKFNLSTKAQLQISKLLFARDEALYDKPINEIWDKEVLQSNFWLYWKTMFAFKDEHSALEVKKYMQRFIHHIGGLPTLSALRFCKYNNYEAMILPLENYLKPKGVQFRYNTMVTDVRFTKKDGRKTATCLTFCDLKSNKEETIFLDNSTLVFFTNGSNTSNISLGNHKTPAQINTEVTDTWKLWEKIAAQDVSFGHPEKFLADPDLTLWQSGTITTLNNDKYPEILDAIMKITQRDPRSGRVTTGGIVTARDSGWVMSWTINRQPQFREQDAKKQTVIWMYGLYPERPGNFIRKPMLECSGEEVTAEWMYHIGIPEDKIPALAKKACSTSLCIMPRVTTYFVPRRKGDRPQVVPEGVTNFAFLGNHVECGNGREVCFTTEMSIRSAMEGVYTLAGVDRAVPEVWGSIYDIRDLLNATLQLRDGKPLNEMELPVPEWLRAPLERVAAAGVRALARKLNKTDIGLLLKRIPVIRSDRK